MCKTEKDIPKTDLFLTTASKDGSTNYLLRMAEIKCMEHFHL